MKYNEAKMVKDNVANAVRTLQHNIHAGNVAAGWWRDADILKSLPTDSQEMSAFVARMETTILASKIALAHSELSEGLEGLRKNLADDKLPHRSMLEVEIADNIIRCLDIAGYLGLDVGGAIMEKLDFNSKREDHKIENRDSAGGKSI